MALRALTPSGGTHCSECGADTPRAADACAVCGRPFQGELEAKRCPFCGGILMRSAMRCYHCGISLPAEPGVSEESFFKSVMDAAAARAGATPSAPGKPLLSGSLDPLASNEAVLWKLSEPFEKILQSRKKRIEQMDALVSRARRRIKMLETSNNPVELREREELKRQVEEILVEREDILKIEEGITEMERTYHNILNLQQSQLRVREDPLRGRMEMFRKELERQEQEKAQIKEKEGELVRRGEEFRRLVESLQKRERELATREDQMNERLRSLEEQARRLAVLEDGIQRRARPPELTTESGARTSSQEITLKPSDVEIRDLKLRISELEENMEHVLEEKNQLAEDRKRTAAFGEDVKSVLKVLDELLGKLPEDEIKKFARSKNFSTYEKIFEEYGL